jgi:general secretion pathway protein I
MPGKAVQGRRTGRAWSGGFTLLETIIAFAILSFALVAAMQAFSSGLRSQEAAEGTGTAVLHARSKIDEIGTAIPLVPGLAGGVYADGSRWQASISPYPNPVGGYGVGSGSGRPVLAAYLVSVTVSWGASRAVTIETVKLGGVSVRRRP